MIKDPNYYWFVFKLNSGEIVGAFGWANTVQAADYPSSEMVAITMATCVTPASNRAGSVRC